MITWSYDHDDDMIPVPEVLLSSADRVEILVRWTSEAGECEASLDPDLSMREHPDPDMAEAEFAPSADFMRRLIEQAFADSFADDLADDDVPVHATETARTSGAGADWTTFTYIITLGGPALAGAAVLGGVAGNMAYDVLKRLGRSIADACNGTFRPAPDGDWSEQDALYWAFRFAGEKFVVDPEHIGLRAMTLDGPRAAVVLSIHHGTEDIECTVGLELGRRNTVRPKFTVVYPQ